MWFKKGKVFSVQLKFEDFIKELEEENEKKKDNNENISKFTYSVLSMLTFNQINEYLLELIPKFFLKLKEIIHLTQFQMILII